jgi:hypothetical protein
MGDQSFRFYLSSVELRTEKLNRNEQQDVELVICEDEHSDKELLVYQISINTYHGHTTVAFRGRLRDVSLFDAKFSRLGTRPTQNDW